MTNRSLTVDLDPLGLQGTILDGRYRVERVVGHGGFGVVYRARHLRLDGPVAIKVLNVTNRPGSIASLTADFELEGKILFSLGGAHPSFVRVLECGTVQLRMGIAVPYLALEWIDGISLEEELQHRRKHGIAAFSLEEAISLLDPAVEGLIAAHEQGIAHRDLKPAHFVMINQGARQTAKLLDFGLAKIVEKGASFSDLLAFTTGARRVFTPAYGAPEQWERRLGATGPWTDVHSLAVVLAEALTGVRVLAGTGADSAQLLCLDVARRPTPRTLGAAVSDDVESAFLLALKVDPRERFHTAGAFWTALKQAAGWRPELRRLVPLHAPPPVWVVRPEPPVSAEQDPPTSDVVGPDEAFVTEPLPIMDQSRPAGVAPPSARLLPGRDIADIVTMPSNVDHVPSQPAAEPVEPAVPPRRPRAAWLLAALGALVAAGAAGAWIWAATHATHDSSAPQASHAASATPSR